MANWRPTFIIMEREERKSGLMVDSPFKELLLHIRPLFDIRTTRGELKHLAVSFVEKELFIAVQADG